MLAWHFVSKSQRLGYGDDRLVRAGVTYRHDGPLVLCESGLHASERLIDALSYARGPYLCRVRLGGEIIKEDDKVVASKREVLSIVNVAPQLREFARWCALQVIHLWDAPEVVREYLETGDQELRRTTRETARGVVCDAEAWPATEDAALAASRAASRAAALAAVWAAERAAVWEAARSAAWNATAAAAWNAAWDSAQDAARAAARVEAMVAAREAAWDAAREKQNKKLEEIVAEMRVF